MVSRTFYSARKASSGENWLARKAGITEAIRAENPSASAAAGVTTGLCTLPLGNQQEIAAKEAGAPAIYTESKSVLTAEDKEEIKKIVTEAVGEAGSRVDAIAEVMARAMEVLGGRERALRWLNTPVRSLDGRTPLSLLNQPGGIERVQDALGQIERGVW